ncbi:MAG: hypothetical protein IT215_05060 [Chitinophagaceae bacterium]|nr:MAG: hypothetical protein UZ11_BCD004000202 [Bacteroidetes bacterium OLB11]MCC6448036.1 hypothetical protein [Chitinophagaceae bacterium]HMN31947.1 hypothetical protein [Chitinophagaceae bacterium]
MIKQISFITISLLILINSCNQQESNSNTDTNTEQKTIKDPNNPKPMALMMRKLASNCDSMKSKINKGEIVDSFSYPIMPFWSAEPTDSSVLEPLFFDNAKQFQLAYQRLMQNKSSQKENYTTLINACIHCHTSYCSGPLKKIRKLTLDYNATK